MPSKGKPWRKSEMAKRQAKRSPDWYRRVHEINDACDRFFIRRGMPVQKSFNV